MPFCPTWSHFIQDKLKISLYLSLDKCKICIKFINFVFHILINYYEFTCCIENSVDPDQLIWIYTVYMRVDICMVFILVFESVNKLICTVGRVKFSLDKYIMSIYLSLDK